METPNVLTEAEMKELGIDPTCPFSTCPRTKGAPLDVRIGDGRLVRREHDGGVEYLFGYYTEAQKRTRQIAARLLHEAFLRNMAEVSPGLFGDGFAPGKEDK